MVLSWSKTRRKKANTPLPISSLSRDVAETELKSASLTKSMAVGFIRRKTATLLTTLWLRRPKWIANALMEKTG